MTLGQILALIAIIIGIIAGVGDGTILFNSVTWFVLAIALDLTLGTPILAVPGRKA